MYQKRANAVQRARISRGLTQEALAEHSGYSIDSIRAWETGARVASIEALGILTECLQTQWLTGVYLREQTTDLSELIPSFAIGKPLPEAAAAYITCLLDLVEGGLDRKLLRMVADGKIDELELPDYERLMRMAEKVNCAFFEMKFAGGGPIRIIEEE